MTTTMRPLSANSYALLVKHSCPGIAVNMESPSDRMKAAVMWHYAHTAGIDVLERMDEHQFRDAVTAHGYAMPPQLLPDLFKQMTAELQAVNDAFVETESEGIPLEQTTATSQTTP